MANNISEADLKAMRGFAQAALSEPGVIAGKPVGKAAEYMAMADIAETRTLRDAFMEGCLSADYYTESRAMKALIALDSSTRRQAA
jgi:hypothetical protein